MEFDELLVAVEDAYKHDDKNILDEPYPDASDLIFLIKCIIKNKYWKKNYMENPYPDHIFSSHRISLVKGCAVTFNEVSMSRVNVIHMRPQKIFFQIIYTLLLALSGSYFT